ncbi:MAG: hypothetical protein NTX56_02235 [Proteobacteria bacterium]|nr:hypothetical protein [Pseudomonadota bacterium]
MLALCGALQKLAAQDAAQTKALVKVAQEACSARKACAESCTECSK